MTLHGLFFTITTGHAPEVMDALACYRPERVDGVVRVRAQPAQVPRNDAVSLSVTRDDAEPTLAPMRAKWPARKRGRM